MPASMCRIVFYAISMMGRLCIDSWELSALCFYQSGFAETVFSDFYLFQPHSLEKFGCFVRETTVRFY